MAFKLKVRRQKTEGWVPAKILAGKDSACQQGIAPGKARQGLAPVRYHPQHSAAALAQRQSVV